MHNSETQAIRFTFASRLDTLGHLLSEAERAFEHSDTDFLELRLAPDMLPFGTQVAFTCNQPRNFARWCQGQPDDNLAPEVADIQQARRYIDDTQKLLASTTYDDAKLAETMHIDLGPNGYLKLSGTAYINDFLLPNFYFHLVAAYAILRMAGLDIGKRDYMLHLVPHLKQK